MKFTTATIAALAGAAAVTAQSNTSICDKYSQALFMSTNGTVQKTLLTLVVNSALIGNYSSAATKQPIPSGILTKNGTYQGQTVNLLKYFDGSLLSTNRNGMPSSVNFLDGGGAAPLKENKPATDDNSNQAKLVNHLYSYFGYLLGCSSLGKEGFSNYEGSTSQYNVHKYMNLNPAEMGYFIQEVAYSALSFGVSMDDVQTVGTALGNTFNNKCANPAAVPASAQPAVQSICLDPSCPTAPNGTCSADNQGPGTAPAAASGASSGSGGSSASMTGSPSGTQTSSGAAQTSSRPNSADSLKAPAALLLGAAVGIAALV